MKKYLIDANLSKVFSFFNSEVFVHVRDINPKMPDSEIWQYAIENNLVILSKDVDFYKRILIDKGKCKVIFLSLGNMKLAELHKYFEKNWKIIVKQIKHCNLIVAERDTIKAIL